MMMILLGLALVAIVLGGYAWSLRTRKWPDKTQQAPRLDLDFPHVAPPMLHLLDKLTERPICGASLREAWTIEHEKATCPECRKEADMAMLQWWTNNR